MKPQKQTSTLILLRSYMGKKGVLMPFSIMLSVLANLAGMIPFVYVWLIIRLLFTQGASTAGDEIVRYAWWAFGFSILFILFYFSALMLSHLAAFRLERNLRYSAMQKAVHMPLGFFTMNSTGKMRKVIDDNADIVHTFVAHQLPDLAGGITVFLTTVILMLLFDWRLGLACLVPLVIAFSHAVPQLVGSFITLLLAMVGLGFMDWQLAIAVFWVVPVAVLTLFITKRMQTKEHRISYLQKRAVTEKIQEGIQQIQEIKSYGQEERYLDELSAEQGRFEKGQIKG